MDARDPHTTPDPTREPRRAVHAVRDLEESERLRQLGAIVVHDLNNAMFALSGRLQLLRRKLDPSGATAVDGALETVRMLEAQLAALRGACPRDEPAETGCDAREAIAAALASAGAALPEGCELAGVAAALGSLDAGLPHASGMERDALLEVDASPSEVASAVRQLVSLHRARGASSIAVEIACERATSAALLLRIHFEDRAGAPRELPTIPSLLGGAFRLADLPLAAAHRATREFGGKVEVAATAHGLRSSLAFEVRAVRDSPASDEAPGDEKDAPANAQGASRPLRILIADDDAGVRAVLVAALESGDHDVEAISLPSAVAARGDLAEFDAVILDAGGGGVEALRALRGRGEGVPVLLASGDIVDAKGDDRTRTLLKPFALGSLEATLRELSALRPRG